MSTINGFEIMNSWANHRKIKIQSFDEITSTNDFAKNILTTEPQIISARHQSLGRGRGNHTWLDVHDDGQMLTSFIFKMERAPQPIATAIIGYFLWAASRAAWPLGNWSLKAPNDLLLNNKKIAGLLIEAISQGSHHQLIIGLGFNLSSHPAVLTETSTHLTAHLPESLNSLESFLNIFWNHLTNQLDDLTQKTISPDICAQICLALNQNNSLPEPCLRVLGDGSLQFKNHTRNWLDL